MRNTAEHGRALVSGLSFVDWPDTRYQVASADPCLADGIAIAFPGRQIDRIPRRQEGWTPMKPLSSLIIAIVLGAASLAITGSASASRQSAAVRARLDGEQWFRAYCAACHGVDGKGHGPAASALKTAPADLTLIAERNRGTFPRALIAGFVANGTPAVAAHGSTDMPIWGPNFVALAGGSYRPVDERIEAVVSYVESIQTVRQ
jgi:mono/diheme cytochrome c family protein